MTAWAPLDGIEAFLPWRVPSRMAAWISYQPDGFHALGLEVWHLDGMAADLAAGIPVPVIYWFLKKPVHIMCLSENGGGRHRSATRRQSLLVF